MHTYPFSTELSKKLKENAQRKLRKQVVSMEPLILKMVLIDVRKGESEIY